LNPPEPALRTALFDGQVDLFVRRRFPVLILTKAPMARQRRGYSKVVEALDPRAGLRRRPPSRMPAGQRAQ